MRHKGWMSSVAYWLGLAAIVSLPFRTDYAFAWLLLMAAVYLVGSATLSVGYHRLFCHNSFKTSGFWHWFFAVSGVAFMYSSPLQWVVTHAAHHKNSDTDLDPHPRPWVALFKKDYRDVPLDKWKARKLVRQGVLHPFVDRYYVGIFAALVGAMFAVSPEFVLNAYLPALGAAHLVGGIHHTFSHANGSPRDLPFMEFLLPASGEWLHGRHHQKAGLADFRTKWWHIDTGAVLIRLIQAKQAAVRSRA